MAALGEVAGAESGRVAKWTNGKEPPPKRETCDNMAAAVGLDADELWASAAWARPKLHDDERRELVRQYRAIDHELAALRERLAKVTAERDGAIAALRSPEVEARVAALVNDERAKEKATRQGRAWDSLLRLTARVAETWPAESESERATRSIRGQEAEARGESVEPFRRGPDVAPVGYETATRVVEWLVAVLSTAAQGPDRGRRLLDTLRRFGDVKDWEARSRLLDSFAGSVEATYVMAWRAGAGPDTRPMPEVGLLGSESVDERRASEHAKFREEWRRFEAWGERPDPPE